MSGLKIYNTLTARKDEFVPITPGRVLMYACGPTVYDLSHLGHARMALTFDVIQRYLRFSGFDVTFVRNLTDVDDKIIGRAKEMNLRAEQVARQYTFTFWRDMHNLNAASPCVEPRATEHVFNMIEFAGELIARGNAYESKGDVYFDVSSFADYGKLKKQSLEELLHGAREQVRSQDELRELKKSPVDFALWKRADPSETGWRSPWGWGRPGWHLECSTMIKHVLGETIDIHGGGEDLVFPHHENEIAQSEALHGKPLARYWIHNSFVQVEAEKMSKSLGNFRTIANVLEQYSPDTVRLFVLQTHYRSPIEFTTESMEAAKAGALRLIRAARAALDNDGQAFQPGKSEDPTIQKLHNDFVEAMDNDFNAPQAVSALFGAADAIFSAADETTASKQAHALRHYAGVLGLSLADTARVIDQPTATGLVQLLLSMREVARANKDYKQSDLIRDELAKLGIKVMDMKGGAAQWERV